MLSKVFLCSLQIKVYLIDLVLLAHSPQMEARWAHTVWGTSGQLGPPANTKALALFRTAVMPVLMVRFSPFFNEA